MDNDTFTKCLYLHEDMNAFRCISAHSLVHASMSPCLVFRLHSPVAYRDALDWRSLIKKIYPFQFQGLEVHIGFGSKVKLKTKITSDPLSFYATEHSLFL